MPDVMLRALIVDDEPPARDRIRSLLENETDVHIVGECGDGDSAVAVIQTEQPNVVFLDVEMPERSGFDVLRALDLSTAGELHVVFVTAYDQYALRAFEVHAADYLLKPFDRDRFQTTLTRVRQRVGAHEWPKTRAQLEQLIHDVVRTRTDSKLVVNTKGRMLVVDPRDVEWIEAKGNYVCVHANGQEHLIRETLTSIEKRLDPACFARIHRSTLVNLTEVRELHPLFHGEYTVVLRSGARLTLSRSYRDVLKRQFPGI